MVQVGVRHHGVLTHDIQAPDLACFRSIHNLSDSQTGLTGEGNTPGLLKLLPDGIVEYLLVGGVIGGQAAHVAGTLNVVLTAQGVDTAAVLADLAAQQCQVGGTHNALGAGGMLGDAHGIVDAGLVSLGIEPGGLLQFFLIDLADLGNHLGGVVLDHFLQGFVAFGALVDIFLILQVLGNDDVHHAVEQGHIGAGLDLQEHVCFPAQGNPAGLSHDDLGTLLLCLTDQRTDDRVSLGGVGAGDEDHILVSSFGNGVGHSTGAQGDCQTCHSGSMAQTGTVVHIVGAESSTDHLLEDVVVLVGAAGAGKACQSIGTGFCLNGLNLISNVGDGFFPGGFHQRTILADQRLGQTVLVIDKVITGLTLDAEQTLVGLAVQRLCAYDRIVLHLQLQLAAHTAVGTGSGDLLGLKGTNAHLGFGQQGTHGANRNTVAAGDTVGAPDQLVKGRCDLCLKAPAGDADGSFAVELLADIDTALAQNTLIGIVSKEFVGIIDGVFVSDTLKAGLLHTVLVAQVLQLAVAVFAAAEAVGFVGGQHQIQNRSSGGDDLLGLGEDHVALGHRGGAGGEQLGIALDLHKADPAGCLGSQILQIAQGWNLNTHAPGSLQNGAALLGLHFDAVNCYVQHNFLLNCIHT